MELNSQQAPAAQEVACSSSQPPLLPSPALLRAIDKTAAASEALPYGADFFFFQNFKFFKDDSRELQREVARQLQHIAGSIFGGKGKWGGDVSLVADDVSRDDEVVENGYEWLVEMVDSQLEEVQICLDEIRSKRRKTRVDSLVTSRSNPFDAAAPAASQPDPNLSLLPSSTLSRLGSASDLKQQQHRGPIHMKHLVKPQEQHGWAVDNSHEPFVLPHADGCEEQTSSSRHPMQDLLLSLEYPPWQLEEAAEQFPAGLESVEFQFVESEEELRDMVEEVAVKGVKEMAVDLENHSVRSFLGFVCLMQVTVRFEDGRGVKSRGDGSSTGTDSSRHCGSRHDSSMKDSCGHEGCGHGCGWHGNMKQKDYIIDAIKLRHQIGPLLGPLFANPDMLKVMHGADYDIQWLQRDFGIVVVNLFDTGQASRVLSRPRHSLASLLLALCQVEADKRLQLADWRLRPLPLDMIKYAREDTHYLLFIYDHLKNQLLNHQQQQQQQSAAKPMLLEVLDRSRDICLQVYEKPRFNSTGYLRLLSNQSMSLSLLPQQEAALKALYSWRDSVAREEDESCTFVLSNNLVLSIAQSLPSTVAHLKKIIRSFAPIAAKRAAEVVRILQEATDEMRQMDRGKGLQSLGGMRGRPEEVEEEGVLEREDVGEEREEEQQSSEAKRNSGNKKRTGEKPEGSKASENRMIDCEDVEEDVRSPCYGSASLASEAVNQMVLELGGRCSTLAADCSQKQLATTFEGSQGSETTILAAQGSEAPVLAACGSDSDLAARGSEAPVLAARGSNSDLAARGSNSDLAARGSDFDFAARGSEAPVMAARGSEDPVLAARAPAAIAQNARHGGAFGALLGRKRRAGSVAEVAVTRNGPTVEQIKASLGVHRMHEEVAKQAVGVEGSERGEKIPDVDAEVSEIAPKNETRMFDEYRATGAILGSVKKMRDAAPQDAERELPENVASGVFRLAATDCDIEKDAAEVKEDAWEKQQWASQMSWNLSGQCDDSSNQSATNKVHFRAYSSDLKLDKGIANGAKRSRVFPKSGNRSRTFQS